MTAPAPGGGRVPAWLLRLILAGTAWAVLELASFGGLLVLQAARGVTYDPLSPGLSTNHRAILDRLLAGRTDYNDYSAVLGWTIKPGGAAPPLYRANGRGLRGDREYAAAPAADTLRIATFGDSFTHGDGVANAETWQVTLEAALPGSEVLNFGVGGFGLDQALLRYREEGTAYRADVVLIGYLTENINRHVNVYRPFYSPKTFQPLTKPRFAIEGDGLHLLPNPLQPLAAYRALLARPDSLLPILGRHDYYYRSREWASRWDLSPTVRLLKVARRMVLQRVDAPTVAGAYNVRSEAFAVTARLFDEFVRDVSRRGARPLIVIFPTRDDLKHAAAGRAYQPLLDTLRARGHDVVDLLEAFPECRTGCDLQRIAPGHYTPAANRTVGQYLAAQLRARGWTTPAHAGRRSDP